MELKYESRIDGEFEGWDGETIFQLLNGTRWKQYKYAYKYSYKYRPKVRIWKDGSKFFLDVEGLNKMLQVVRLYDN